MVADSKAVDPTKSQGGGISMTQSVRPTPEYNEPDDARLLDYGEFLITDNKEKYSVMDIILLASHGVLMRVEKSDDGKLLCAKIQANKITKKQYPGDFERELKALQMFNTKKIDNKYLPHIYGSGKTEEISFFITDHVGETLQRQLLKFGQLSPTSTFRVCRYLISAMKTVHEIGLVHGNIRPSAILVGGPQERDIIRLFGFQFSSEHPQKTDDNEAIGYPLDQYTARGIHKGERAKPKHDMEMYINFMYSLTIGLPWAKARTLKELTSRKETFWKKAAKQEWGKIPPTIKNLAINIDKEADLKIDYAAIEHELDELLRLLPSDQSFEWEDASRLACLPQRKGPTVIQPLDIGVAKQHKFTAVERCEAVLQPDL
ncbi:unnamed protein product [Cylicocyclus nassatus]|uniref:Protein kinase domain-containing protein n=1 Tax=Cylicocyclus nassatus TaxID=53992 RepID=A0AA36H964_CYLNA|nr:unnamed protein product [Cylicocyclus nassatus]